MKSTHNDVLLEEDSLKRHFNFVDPELYKLIRFQVSNQYNEMKNKNKNIKWIKHILQDIQSERDADKTTHPMDVVAKGLILGAIPKSDQINDIITKAKEDNNTNPPKEIHIFSITDEFEQSMPGMLQPKELATPIHEIPFKHHQVPMTDFGAEITSQSILAAVYKMRKIIEEGGTVYIHCKAGKARSAMIVATYLAIFGDKENLNINEKDQSPLKRAVDYLKLKRSQVDLHDDKVDD